MNRISFIGLLSTIIACACFHQTTKGERTSDSNSVVLFELENGLRIENKVNRGLAFTDSLGDKYALTYIPVIVSNDGIKPLNFNLNFSSEYAHPLKESNEKFRLVVMPEKWTPDPMTITDSMILEIPEYAKELAYKKTLQPNQKYVFAIGTLRPSPAKICGIIPNSLFVNQINDIYPDCNWQMQKHSTNFIEIGLKLDYCHTDKAKPNCTIISCGQVSYLNN